MVTYASLGVVVVTLVLTGFFATVSRVSLLILKGLHAYLLPEELDKNAFVGNEAEKEAETADKPKKKVGKNKERDIFHEAGGQIHRIRLVNGQLETRKYFQEFDEAVIYSCVGLTNVLTREILRLVSNSSLVEQYGWVEIVTPDDRISFMVGIFSVFKLFLLLAKVSYDPQLARKWEKFLNWSAGVVGFVVASAILILVPTSIIDFGIDDAVVDAGKCASCYMRSKGIKTLEELAISPTSMKLVMGAAAGVFSGLLFGPALRNVKNFWVGTDQMQWNITVLKKSSLVRPFLNLSVVLPLLVSLLWVKPMAEVFVRPLNHPNSSLYNSASIPTSGNVEGAAGLSYTHGYKKFDDLGPGDVEFEGQVGSQDHSMEHRFPHGEYKPESVASRKQFEFNQGNPGVKDALRVQVVNAGSSLSPKEMAQNLQEEDETGVLSRVYITRQSDWAEGFGILRSTFDQIRFWSLSLTGLLQIILFRMNLQTYCDGAVLIWYENLHQSKVHNTEIARAKIFLNNYFVCRVAVQSLVPGVLVLLMIGLGRTRGSHLDKLVRDGAFFFAPSLVRRVMEFCSWWLVFSPALQTWVTLALFRVGLMSSTA